MNEVETNSKDTSYLKKQSTLQLQLIETPLPMNRTIDLIHKDQSFIGNVKFSTFTPFDDILVLIENKFLIFDKQGRPLHLKIEEKVLNSVLNISDFKVIQVKVVNRSKLALVFEDNYRLTVVLLYMKEGCY